MLLGSCICALVVLIVYLLETTRRIEHKWSICLVIVLISLMMGGNTDNPDIVNYKISYLNSADLSSVFRSNQWLMTLVMCISNKLNLEFLTFRVLFYFFGVLIIFVSIKRYVGYNIWALLFYMVFPMIIDATQMKNFMAMAMLTNAFCYLGDSGLKSKLFYVISCVVGAGFHVICYAYIPLVLILNVSAKKIARFIFAVATIAFSAIFVNEKMLDILASFLLGNVSENLAERTYVFFNSRVENGYIVYVIETVLIFLILFLINKEKNILNDALTNKQVMFLQRVYIAAIYIILFIPLYMYKQDFSRLIRNFSCIITASVLIYMVAWKEVQSEKRMSKFSFTQRGISILILYAVYLGFMFYWDIWVYSDTVVIPFFSENIFL